MAKTCTFFKHSHALKKKITTAEKIVFGRVGNFEWVKERKYCSPPFSLFPHYFLATLFWVVKMWDYLVIDYRYVDLLTMYADQNRIAYLLYTFLYPRFKEERGGILF